MKNLLPSCDTLVALGNSTKNGKLIFAKNSDRPITESQPLVVYPAAAHPAGQSLKCTHISIDQVAQTYRVIGSRPWWLWGFEHGINEHGVVIGNEAAWSNVPTEETDGLIGMDLLRLGLERSRSADEALHVITALLEKYGQGGPCAWGPLGQEFQYHNLFLIADPDEAWILETVQRHWAAKKVRDIACISNLYSIGTDFDECSEGLEEFAIAKGLHIKGREFNFAKSFTKINGGSMSGHARVNRVKKLLVQGKGQIDVPYVTRILRDHFEGEIIEPAWSPVEGFNLTICMHGVKPDNCQTAASAVIEMNSWENSELAFTYWGAMCTPCLSFFVPYYNTGYIPEQLSVGENKYDPHSFWWNTYRLCLGAEANYEKYFAKVAVARNKLEETCRKKAKETEAAAAVLLQEGKSATACKLLNDFSVETLQSVAAEIANLTAAIETDLQLNPGQVYRSCYLKELKQEAGF